MWTSESAKGSTKGVVTFHPLADDLTKVLLVLEYYPSGLVEKTGNILALGGQAGPAGPQAFPPVRRDEG